MKTLRHLVLAAAAFAGLLIVQPPAQAANEYLCAPRPVAATSPGRVTNPGTSGGSYVLNGQGCAVISESNSDAAYFKSQGYTQGPNLFSIVFSTGVLTGTTPVQVTPALPPGTAIRDIYVNNTTSNAVTGGVDIGTTSGAADVVSALTCAASCLTFVADSALLKRVFSLTAQQALFVLGHTAGNSSNLTLTITYSYF
jgi:hypothetical protein